MNFLDIEFEFIKGQAETPEIQQLLAQWAKDPQAGTVYRHLPELPATKYGYGALSA